MSTTMMFDAFYICHQGKIRSNNEDNILFDSKVLAEKHEEKSVENDLTCLDTNTLQLFGVFDGMGGHSNGETASYISAQVAQAYEEKLRLCTDDNNIEALLKEMCLTANEKVCDIRRKKAVYMGSTLSVLCLKKNQCFICNLGDSPIFRMREGELVALHEEHTGRRLYEAILGKEQIKDKKFSLTQHVGIYKEELLIEPFVRTEEIKKHDIFLICSDGLTDMVDEKQISFVLNQNFSIKEKVRMLRDEALLAGGHDNITIVCIEVL